MPVSSVVLYCTNLQYINDTTLMQTLFDAYLGWNERAKQIAKIWRALSSDKRQPYLQKARENRAASRMQKTQQVEFPPFSMLLKYFWTHFPSSYLRAPLKVAKSLVTRETVSK